MHALSNRMGEKVLVEENENSCQQLYVEEFCKIHMIKLYFFEHETSIST